MVRSALALTVVWVVFEALFEVLPSAVPVELTVALLSRMVPVAPAAPMARWTVRTVLSSEAMVTLREQLTTWPLAEQSGLEPVAWRAEERRVGKDTLTPPGWVEGQMLVTVRV